MMSPTGPPTPPPPPAPHHRLARVARKGVPISHSHIDGKPWPVPIEQLRECLRLPERQLIDRRAAADLFIVVRHLFQTAGRDRHTSKHVGQKRANLHRLRGAAL